MFSSVTNLDVAQLNVIHWYLFRGCNVISMSVKSVKFAQSSAFVPTVNYPVFLAEQLKTYIIVMNKKPNHQQHYTRQKR